MGQVVWVEGQKARKFREVFAAAVFHYQRCFFGARYGMGA